MITVIQTSVRKSPNSVRQGQRDEDCILGFIFQKKLHKVEDEFDLLYIPMVKPCFLYLSSGGDHIRRNWRYLGRVIN